MLKYFLIAFLSIGLFGEETPSLKDVPSEGTLSDRRLLSIVKRQESLMERVARTADDDSNVSADVEQQVQALAQDWQRFVTDHPKDLEGRIFYGKFLRTFGQYEAAVEQYLEADRIDDSVHVVKQQIGNYMVEHGLYAEALPWFLQAVALAPEEPRYHFQTGELLFRFRDFFIDDKAFTREAIDTDMQRAFAEAARLSPEILGLHLRYGESFYDVKSPDWAKALEAFQTCQSLATTDNDQQAILLHLARVQVELTAFEEAQKLLAQIHLPALEDAKLKVQSLMDTE